MNADYAARVEDFARLLLGRYDGIPVAQPQDSQQRFGRSDLGRGLITLRTRDDSRTVTTGAGFLAVRSNIPYDGWDDVRARTSEATDAYAQTYQAVQLRSVSVQYENLILISADDDPNSYIDAASGISVDPSLSIQSEYHSASYFDATDGGSLTVALIRYPARAQGQRAISVDLSAGSPDVEGGMPVGDYGRLLDAARQKIVRQFESLITDRARDHFGRTR